MLVDKFSQDLSLLWPTGSTLNVEEKMNLQLALLKLYENEDFEEVLLWGKVRGVMKDYYIALTLNYRGHHEFPHKRFFWSTNQNWVFAELSGMNPGDKDHAEKFNSIFTGEHDKILIEAPGQDELEQFSDFEEDSESKSEAYKIPSKNFTELDRLTYVVRSIDQDCSTVPEGAFRMTASHELIRNRSFVGLSRPEVSDIKKYYHFRNVQLPEKKEQLDRDEAISSFDFLDPVDKDIPKGSWSLQVDHSCNLATLRSFVWPGYYAFHEANTQRFGGLYIGDGIKNSDLAFML